jgi:hypothetical protein
MLNPLQIWNALVTMVDGEDSTPVRKNQIYDAYANGASPLMERNFVKTPSENH